MVISTVNRAHPPHSMLFVLVVSYVMSQSPHAPSVFVRAVMVQVSIGSSIVLTGPSSRLMYVDMLDVMLGTQEVRVVVRSLLVGNGTEHFILHCGLSAVVRAQPLQSM